MILALYIDDSLEYSLHMARDRDLVYEMQVQLNTRGRKEQKRRREEVSIFEVNIFCGRGSEQVLDPQTRPQAYTRARTWLLLLKFD